MSTSTPARPADALREGDRPAEAPPGGGSPHRRRRRRLGRRPHRGRQAGRLPHEEGLPRPLVVHARRDRDVLDDRLPADRGVPHLLVRPQRRAHVYDGSYVPLRGVSMSEAYASTLNISFDIKGGLIIRQIHHWSALMFIVALVGAHVPGVLHRRVPQAPRDQLGHRLGPRPPRDHRGLRRLLASRRPALGHRPARHGGVRPDRTGHRVLPRLRHLRRPVPGRDDHPAALQRAHPADPRHPRRRCSPPTSGSCSCRSTPSTPARAGPTRTSSASR